MTDQVILIVGASSGIGLATASHFARQGAQLVLAARGSEGLSRAQRHCEALGAANVVTHSADVSDASAVEHLMAQTLMRCGRVDVVVHSAAVMAYGSIESLPDEIFDRVMGTAVHGTLHLARSALPIMRSQGSGTFIVVNSLLGAITVPKMGAYATAKWAQRALVATLQQENRDTPGVHICLVSPGSVNTPIYDQAANYLGRAARPPMPVLQPEKVAQVIASLTHRPRRAVSVGPINPLIIFGFRSTRTIYDRLVGPLFRLFSLGGSRAISEGNVMEPTSTGPALPRSVARGPPP